uniref:Uncharacterized protein n=2 Tax=Neobodo designis TaxID=312471 RepID=A0A7S1L6H1_NEODS|mmetsp:Transcript_15580/g.48221  ORF Transcript_15580/g.48221 Transcript_15580/m.48221 type:complete len:304 (+) Transcript_15580:43-954(+)
MARSSSRSRMGSRTKADTHEAACGVRRISTPTPLVRSSTRNSSSLTLVQLAVVIVLGMLGVAAACAGWVAVVGAINSKSNFDLSQATTAPETAQPRHVVVPVARLAIWETVSVSVAVPSTLYVSVGGLVANLGYELRVSYLGTPPVRLSLSVLSESDAAAVSKDVAHSPNIGHPLRGQGTHRKLLDCDRVLFTAYGSENMNGTFDVTVPAVSATQTSARTLRIHTEAGAAADPTLPVGTWGTCHMVLSARPVVLGGLPVDAVPVFVACVFGVAAMLLVVCTCLRREVRDELQYDARTDAPKQE